MKRTAETAFETSAADRADDSAPGDSSDTAGGPTAATKLVAACQRFAEPPVPIPRAPFARSAGLGSANVRAIKKGDLDLVGATSEATLVERTRCVAHSLALYAEVS